MDDDGTNIDSLLAPPRNPARMPQAIEDAILNSPIAEKIKHYAAALYDAAKLPGDVWSGREPMHLGLRREDYTDAPDAPQPDERAIAAGVSIGDLMSMGSMPAATENALGVFGGRMAVTADHQALNRAEHMIKSGAAPEDVWRATGWFQGPDGKWRFEISDHAATMNQGAGNKLGDVLQHPELFGAYPALAKVKVAPVSDAAARRGASAAYTPAGMFSSGKIQYPIDGADQLPSTLHEVQHAIQQREGFTGGSSRLAELPAKFGLPFRSDAKRAQEFQDAGDRYWRNAGEVESRNVEARQLMEPTPRRFLSPMETMDVPLSEQSLTTTTDSLPSKLLKAAQVGGAGMGAAASAVQIADAIAELKAKRKEQLKQVEDKRKAPAAASEKDNLSSTLKELKDAGKVTPVEHDPFK